MQAFFKELFEYQHHFNQRLIDDLREHFGQLSDSTFPLFCHILNAHQVWNSRIIQQPSFGVWQLHDIDVCKAIDDTNFKETVSIIDSEDLERVISYKTSKGDPFSNKVKDILFHVINHTTHHRGQIVADFRLQGIDPIMTDYIFYKR